MIRVNLIAESVPQARGEPMRLSNAMQVGVLVLCLAGAVGWLIFDYFRTEAAITQVQHELALQHVALTRLNELRTQVATFERQKTAIDRRIELITQLESNREESRQVLDSLANTVNQTPLLWLTGVSRKGDSLTIEGQAGSINAVASFISELRLSGHFNQIQMKTTQQQPNRQVTTFHFNLSAEYLDTPSVAPSKGGE